MPAVKFTAKWVQAIKPPQSGRIDYIDDGLTLRVSESGHKSWGVFYRFNHRFRRMTFGSYPNLSLKEAREMADEVLHAAANRKDPKDLGAEKKAEREAGTFGSMVENFLGSRIKRGKPKKSNPEFKRIFEKYFGDWYTRKVHDITTEEVLGRINREMRRGEAHARKSFAVLRAAFNFARIPYKLKSSPMDGLKMPGEKNDRERVLSSKELRALVASLKFEDRVMAIHCELRLQTSQRGGEVLSIEWPEIDFEMAMWSLPGEKAKNGQPSRIPLTRQAMILLRELKGITGNQRWAFPCRYKLDQPIRNIQKFAQRVRCRAGAIERLWSLGKEVTDSSIVEVLMSGEFQEPDYTLHDIRRTLSTGMASLGVPQHVIDKINNHIDGKVNAVYNRYGYDKEKREGLQLWANYLDELITNGSAKTVVPIKASDKTSEFLVLNGTVHN